VSGMFQKTRNWETVFGIKIFSNRWIQSYWCSAHFFPHQNKKKYSGTNHNITIKINHYIDIYEILRFSSETKTGISPSEINKFISLCYITIKNIIESLTMKLKFFFKCLIEVLRLWLFNATYFFHNVKEQI
jgi:hypothetical protein